MIDIEIQELIALEAKRQDEHIELIASENFVSQDVLEACGSILTNKYAEGYPNRRYYGGCEYVDKIEQLAIDRLKQLFGCEHANVQPHCGSSANMAVYQAVLSPNDKVLAMSLNEGGHLTHGHHLNFSGNLYDFHFYGVDCKSALINYDEVLRIAQEVKPKLIVAGASAYSGIIDFKKFKEIADEVGAYLMADIAHIAGLVISEDHPSPIPYCDFVTSTTHKTLRGPRGGIIMCKTEFAKQIDMSVFPGIQGGPLMHIIGAKAICFKEAQSEEYKEYMHQVKKNAIVLCNALKEEGVTIVSNTTSNHLILVDVKTSFGLSGKEVETLLDQVNITCNKNSIPNDSLKPMITSGIRLGTPAMTTIGFKENDFEIVAKLICKAIKNKDNLEVLNEIKNEVIGLCKQFKKS